MRKRLTIVILCIMAFIMTGFSEETGTDQTGSGELLFLSWGSTCVVSSVLDGRVLGVNSGSVYPGAGVQLQEADGSAIQKWILQNAGSGYYYMRNLHSWKVLEMTDSGLYQSEEDGSSGQLWRFLQTNNGNTLVVNARGIYLRTAADQEQSLTTFRNTLPEPELLWEIQITDSDTALDFQQDGIQTIGIRSFQISQGNVTELSDYYPVTTDIDLPDGGYSLSGGRNFSIGIKTLYVNRFLSLAGYLNGKYLSSGQFDGNTTDAVARFQTQKGLLADGIVDESTWKAMGYSDYEYRHLGDYRTSLKVPAYGSSRDVCVQAMLDTAKEYKEARTAYLAGASGKPGTYIDCSGLIFQCLYSAGINPQVNIIDHARNDYDYCSWYLGQDAKLGETVTEARAGDLIFYGSGTISHVGICAGNGMVYDSTPEYGVAYRNMYAPGNIMKIIRVF